MRFALIALAVSLAAPAAFAGPRAAGTLGSRDVQVKIVDAYAYPDKAEFGDDEVISVRLSTVPLDPTALDPSLDRESVLDTQAAESPSLKLQFDKAGRWTGSSYYLGSGNGCGYCSAPSAPGVSVKVVDGVLRGALVVKAADYADGKGLVANLTLDVPVARAPAATALPADGGAPGKAYLACVQAIGHKDVAAFRAACGVLEDELAYAERERSLDSFWENGTAGYGALTLATVKVTGGRATEGEALLTIAGADKDGNKHKGTVLMTKVGAGWRYHKGEVEAVYE